MPLVDVDRLKQGGQKFVSGFTPGQKVMSVLGIAGLVAAMFMFSKWSTKPNYAPLFSNLSSKDAGDITKALDGMNVPYQLTDGGGTIMVPQTNLYKTRVDLSAKGLPANSDGYALLDKAGITTSDFTQHVDYQRAVQTELANTIMAINGVQGATVNLALPTDDPFVGDTQQKATAAVQVDTGGVQMAPEQVQAIVHLVSASVKDLSPDGITVSDTMGHLLYTSGGDGSFTSSQNMSRTLAYEDSVQTQVNQQLAAVLGAGHSAVSVMAKLDFTQGTTDRTTNVPVVDKKGNPIAGSTSKHDTNLTQPGGANSNTGGILGTTTGGTAVTGGTGGSGTEKYSEKDDQTQNIVDQTHSTTTNPPFTVQSMSVSVALDQSKVTPAQLPALRSLIAAATGINPSVAGSADQLVVERTAMDPQQQKLAQQSSGAAAGTKSAATPLDLMGILRYVITLLIVALVLFFAWRSVKKAHAAMGTVRMPLDLVALEGGAGAGLAGHELAAGLPTAAVGALGAGALGAPEPRKLPSSPLEMEVGDLIERQPEEVAQTLRSWLAERRS